ncbi:MAG: hypothetical protein ACR652_24375 [Methylocystis sp.]|uniref:hypothetical protein n=1 Tax=Methylocystis sp. TaxID=1911079 RepID=UPI003DA62158
MNWPSVVFLALLLGGFFMFGKAVKPLALRLIAVFEQRGQAAVTTANAAIVAATPAPLPEPTKRDKLPLQIRQIAEQWKDPWACEQTMDYYCEIYDQTQSWDQVMGAALADQARYLKAKGELS